MLARHRRVLERINHPDIFFERCRTYFRQLGRRPVSHLPVTARLVKAWTTKSWGERGNGLAKIKSYYSGRNAYYMEHIVNAGLVGIHLASAKARVAPLGGASPALGTNPICFGVPSANGPVIVDMGTAALQWGEVLLHAHLDKPLPEGVGLDAEGRPTQDAQAAILGGVLPFGGHKGYGLSVAVQAMGLLAGAAWPRGQVQDYGFLFVVFDPGLLVPAEEFEQQVAELMQRIKGTPRQPGVEEIRIPSERAFREREQRRAEGLVLERKVVESLQAL